VIGPRALLRRLLEYRWDRQYEDGLRWAREQLRAGVPADRVLAQRSTRPASQRDLGIAVAVLQWPLPHGSPLAGAAGGATLVSNECKRSSSSLQASEHVGKQIAGAGG
jgi:hypothetical protein